MEVLGGLFTQVGVSRYVRQDNGLIVSVLLLLFYVTSDMLNTVRQHVFAGIFRLVGQGKTSLADRGHYCTTQKHAIP